MAIVCAFFLLNVGNASYWQYCNKIRLIQSNMKKIISVLLVVFMAISPMLSQVITKTESVYHKMTGEYSCRHIDYLLGVGIIYDKDMNPTYYSFEFAAQNSEYDCMSDLFVLKNGTSQEIYDLLVEIENFGNKVKEKGISISYEDYKFTRWNFGIRGKYISVSYEDKYHAFKDREITKIKNKLIEYCKEKNIELSK